LAIGVATPKNIYNALTKLTQNAGFKSPEEFWTDPGDKPFQPPSDPKLAITQMELQADQQKFQAETVLSQQNAEKQAQIEMKLEQWKQSQQAADTQHTQELEARRDIHKAQIEAQLETNRQEFERWKVEFTEAAKIVQAQISAKLSDPALQQAEQVSSAEVTGSMGQSDMMAIHAQTLEAIRGIMEQMARPKTLVRGPDGRAVGIQ
jgi:hypothetical protein